MRRMAFGCLLLLVAALSGCSTRFVDFAPEEEAIYEYPIDEVWPQVRTYFTSKGFAFRETPGRGPAGDGVARGVHRLAHFRLLAPLPGQREAGWRPTAAS